MPGNGLRDHYAIVGIGQTPTLRTHAQGKSGHQLEAWAARIALDDAGLRREDIDGAVHAGINGTGGDGYSRKLGLGPNFYIGVSRGGAAGIEAIAFACATIASGNATCVMVSNGSAMWSAGHAAPGSGGKAMTGGYGSLINGLSLLGYTAVPGAASVHAFYASRHMHEYGTTHEQLGAVATAQRAWAQLNPDARFYGRPATIADYLASPWVVHPLRRMDNCVVSDVGHAFIVTTADRAKHLRRKPVYIKGIGFGDGARLAWWQKTNFTETDAGHAKDVAFRQAGIGIEDVDVAEHYDCFTSEFIFYVEDYGWCKKGDGGPFVESGATAPGGKHPMNTHGGMLSSVHGGDMGNLHEAVVQLRGDGGDRQVKGAEIAIANGHGGEYVLPYMCPIHGTIVFGSVLS